MASQNESGNTQQTFGKDTTNGKGATRGGPESRIDQTNQGNKPETPERAVHEAWDKMRDESKTGIKSDTGQPKPGQGTFTDDAGKTRSVAFDGKDKAYVTNEKGEQEPYKVRTENGKTVLSNERGELRVNDYKPGSVLDSKKTTNDVDRKPGTSSDNSKALQDSKSEPVRTQPEKQKGTIEQNSTHSTEGKPSKSEVKAGPSITSSDKNIAGSTNESTKPEKMDSAKLAADNLNKMRLEQEAHSSAHQKSLQSEQSTLQTQNQAQNQAKSSEQVNRQSVVNSNEQAKTLGDFYMPLKHDALNVDHKGLESNANSGKALAGEMGSIPHDRKDVIDQVSGKSITGRSDVIEQSSIGKQDHQNPGEGKAGIPIPAKAGGGGGGSSPEGTAGKIPGAKPSETGKGKGGDGVGGGGSRGNREEGKSDRGDKGERGNREDGKSDRGEKGNRGNREDGKSDRGDKGDRGSREDGKSDRSDKSEKGEPGKGTRGEREPGDRTDKHDPGSKGERQPDKGESGKGDRGGKLDPTGKNGPVDREPGKGDAGKGDAGKGDSSKGDRSGKVDPTGKNTPADRAPGKGDSNTGDRSGKIEPTGKVRGPEVRYQLDQILLAKIQNFTKQPLDARIQLADVLSKLMDKNSGKTIREPNPNTPEGKVLKQLQDLKFTNEQLKDLRNYILDPKGRPFEFTKYDQKTQVKIAEVFAAISTLKRDSGRSIPAEQQLKQPQTQTAPLSEKGSLQHVVNVISKGKVDAVPNIDQTKTIIQVLNRGAENQLGNTKLTDTLTREIGKQDRTVVSKPDGKAAADFQITSEKFVNQLIARLRDREILPFQKEIVQKQEQKQVLTRLNEIRETANGPAISDQVKTVVSKLEASHIKSDLADRRVKPEQNQTQTVVNEILNQKEDLAAAKLEQTEKLAKEKEQRERDAIVEAQRSKSNHRTRQRYIVQAGDTLNSIAKAFLDDESHAVVIFHNNRDQNQSNSNQDSRKNYKIPLRDVDGYVCAIPLIGASLMIPNKKRVEDFYKLAAAATCYSHIRFDHEAEKADDSASYERVSSQISI